MSKSWMCYLPLMKDDGGNGRRRWISPIIALLAVFSFSFVCYSAFSSGDYRWLCSDCDHGSAALDDLRLWPQNGPAAATANAPPALTNLTHIVFGIGASAKTWNRRQGYSELWWRPGEMRGHVWLDETPQDGAWPATSPPFRVSNDASQFGHRKSASRMARIVAEAYQLAVASGEKGEAEVRWFVMGDDDTLFFVENLVAVLGKYDHEEMYYIGAPSESVEQDVVHSYGMAFGGGGFAVSVAAAKELAKLIDGCLQRYARFYGSDQRVQACLIELGVPLTHEPGFHQVDLRGDAYGMLAAHPVAPLVSLHHLDYLEPIAPRGSDRIGALRYLVDASRSDPARTLQQCFCYESQKNFTWSVSVSWGYTVQIYPWVLEPRELEVPLQTFKTWKRRDGPFTFNTRPFPWNRPCQRPLLYFLDSVEEGKRDAHGYNTTVSKYSRYKKENEEECDTTPSFRAASKIKEVRVFAPKLDPNVWKRAPRRQCCQTRRTIWGNTLHVRIKKCHPGDITAPPR